MMWWVGLNVCVLLWGWVVLLAQYDKRERFRNGKRNWTHWQQELKSGAMEHGWDLNGILVAYHDHFMKETSRQLHELNRRYGEEFRAWRRRDAPPKLRQEMKEKGWY